MLLTGISCRRRWRSETGITRGRPKEREEEEEEEEERYDQSKNEEKNGRHKPSFGF